MAEAVIDRLEVVEVQEHHRHSRRRVGARAQAALGRVEQGAAVQQPRQRVAGGALAILSEGGLQLGLLGLNAVALGLGIGQRLGCLAGDACKPLVGRLEQRGDVGVRGQAVAQQRRHLVIRLARALHAGAHCRLVEAQRRVGEGLQAGFARRVDHAVPERQRTDEVAHGPQPVELRPGLHRPGQLRPLMMAGERLGDRAGKPPLLGEQTNGAGVVVFEDPPLALIERGRRQRVAAHRGVGLAEQLHEQHDAAVLQQAHEERLLGVRGDDLAGDLAGQAGAQNRLLPEGGQVEGRIAEPVEVADELKAQRDHPDPAHAQQRDGTLDGRDRVAARERGGVRHLEQLRRQAGICLDHRCELLGAGGGVVDEPEDLDGDGRIGRHLRAAEDQVQVIPEVLVVRVRHPLSRVQPRHRSGAGAA